jgi:hypothetical protein
MGYKVEQMPWFRLHPRVHGTQEHARVHFVNDIMKLRVCIRGPFHEVTTYPR